MRKTKSFRLTENSINCLKQIAEHYSCTETKILEALIQERFYKLEDVSGKLNFDDIINIIR